MTDPLVTAPKRRRAMSLGPHDVYLLDQWGRQIYEAFGVRPYLVGSVARAEDNWRDVDLRIEITDAMSVALSPLGVRTINLAISLWGRQVTGLPIDFQFQSPAEFDQFGSEARNPMGVRSAGGWQA